jgi:hypothetical protein
MEIIYPWELSESEWKRQREECKGQGQFKFTKSCKHESITKIKKLEWLLYGIKSPDYPVSWHDVVGKAIEEGKLVKCPTLNDKCLKQTKTPLPNGWVWDDSEHKVYAWCPECVRAWGWK